MLLNLSLQQAVMSERCCFYRWCAVVALVRVRR
jgi:hypothetical protein